MLKLYTALLLILNCLIYSTTSWIQFDSKSKIILNDSFLNSIEFKTPLTNLQKFNWKLMGSGLSAISFSFNRSDSSSTNIRLIKFEKGQFNFSMLGEVGRGRPVDYWTIYSKCVAGINGNYYYNKGRDGLKVPLGLIIQDSKTVSVWREKYLGCFYDNGIKSEILYKEKPPANAKMACQSFPVIIYNGVIPEGIRPGANIKIDINKRSRRSAVAQDREGNSYFFISVQDLSFQEMGAICGAIGLYRCLNLDGGSSTQYCVIDKDTVIMSGLERVPFVIGASRINKKR